MHSNKATVKAPEALSEILKQFNLDHPIEQESGLSQAIPADTQNLKQQQPPSKLFDQL